VQCQRSSAIEPLLEQFALLLHHHHLLRLLLHRNLYHIRPWSRHRCTAGDGILLVAEAVAVVLDEHVVWSNFLALLLLLRQSLFLIDHDVSDDLLEMFVIHIMMANAHLLLLPVLLNPLLLTMPKIRPRSQLNLLLLQLGIYSASGLVFEHTRRQRTLALAIRYLFFFGLVGWEKITVTDWVFHGVRLLSVFVSRGQFILGTIERIASVVFGLLENGSLIMFVFVQMVQHILLLLRNKHPVLLLPHPPTLSFTLGLSFRLHLLLLLNHFLLKIAKTLYKLLGQEAFVFIESILLTTKSCGLNILYFEFDATTGYRWYVNVEIVFHKIIITDSVSFWFSFCIYNPTYPCES
jgi:hypothetical protein